MLAVLRSTARLAPEGVPLVQPRVRALIGRLFGAPPFHTSAHAGDPGLFGPGSASWRIIAEPAAIVGGVRALLVQLLHPLAMAGVADHSRFRDAPLERLHRTAGYISATTFGALPDVLAAARAVRRTHDRVHGTAPDGRPYRAGDPALLAWVSMVLTSSFLATDRAYAPRPAEAAVADAFVAEQARAAALLDPCVDLAVFDADPAAAQKLRTGAVALPLVADGRLPTTVAGLEARLEALRPELAVGPQAREALRFLLWPGLPAPVRAGYLPLLAGAAATIPPADRRLLGLRLGPAAAALRAQTALLVAGLRITAGRSPALTAATHRVGAG